MRSSAPSWPSCWTTPRVGAVPGAIVLVACLLASACIGMCNRCPAACTLQQSKAAGFSAWHGCAHCVAAFTANQLMTLISLCVCCRGGEEGVEEGGQGRCRHTPGGPHERGGQAGRGGGIRAGAGTGRERWHCCCSPSGTKMSHAEPMLLMLHCCPCCAPAAAADAVIRCVRTARLLLRSTR